MLFCCFDQSKAPFGLPQVASGLVPARVQALVGHEEPFFLQAASALRPSSLCDRSEVLAGLQHPPEDGAGAI